MKNYFETCTTLDEAKKMFWSLAKTHHPDKGGDTATFQEILNQFEKFVPQTEKFKGERDQWNSKEYASIISALVVIPVIQIEICGSWIWVSGDTKSYKEQIKAIETGASYKRGFSGNKSMWYFSPTGYRKMSSGTMSIDQIRSYYGSEKVKKEERETLAA